jgi:hypothetical protein
MQLLKIFSKKRQPICAVDVCISNHLTPIKQHLLQRRWEKGTGLSLTHRRYNADNSCEGCADFSDSIRGIFNLN